MLRKIISSQLYQSKRNHVPEKKTAYLANIRKMSLQRPKFSIAERHNLFYEKEKKILKVLYDIIKTSYI